MSKIEYLLEEVNLGGLGPFGIVRKINGHVLDKVVPSFRDYYLYSRNERSDKSWVIPNHVMVSGPRYSGKTMLGYSVGYDLGLPVYRVTPLGFFSAGVQGFLDNIKVLCNFLNIERCVVLFDDVEVMTGLMEHHLGYLDKEQALKELVRLTRGMNRECLFMYTMKEAWADEHGYTGPLFDWRFGLSRVIARRDTINEIVIEYMLRLLDEAHVTSNSYTDFIGGLSAYLAGIDMIELHRLFVDVKRVLLRDNIVDEDKMLDVIKRVFDVADNDFEEGETWVRKQE